MSTSLAGESRTATDPVAVVQSLGVAHHEETVGSQVPCLTRTGTTWSQAQTDAQHGMETDPVRAAMPNVVALRHSIDLSKTADNPANIRLRDTLNAYLFFARHADCDEGRDAMLTKANRLAGALLGELRSAEKDGKVRPVHPHALGFDVREVQLREPARFPLVATRSTRLRGHTETLDHLLGVGGGTQALQDARQRALDEGGEPGLNAFDGAVLGALEAVQGAAGGAPLARSPSNAPTFGLHWPQQA